MSDVNMPSTTGRDGTVQILEEKKIKEKRKCIFCIHLICPNTLGMFAWRNSGRIWMVWKNAEEIYERKHGSE